MLIIIINIDYNIIPIVIIIEQLYMQFCHIFIVEQNPNEKNELLIIILLVHMFIIMFILIINLATFS